MNPSVLFEDVVSRRPPRRGEAGAAGQLGARHDPAAVRGLDDLSRLPFTVKDDLRRNYPLRLLAVPQDAPTNNIVIPPENVPEVKEVV